MCLQHVFKNSLQLNFLASLTALLLFMYLQLSTTTREMCTKIPKSCLLVLVHQTSENKKEKERIYEAA